MIPSPAVDNADKSGSKIGSHVALVSVNWLRLYVLPSRKQADKKSTFKKPLPKLRCAFRAVIRNVSWLALIASALDGLSVTKPKSSIVKPVSPAKPLAAILNCSINGCIDGVLNCPSTGFSPSSSFVISSIVETVAFQPSNGSASSEVPTAYFCGNE